MKSLDAFLAEDSLLKIEPAGLPSSARFTTAERLQALYDREAETEVIKPSTANEVETKVTTPDATVKTKKRTKPAEEGGEGTKSPLPPKKLHQALRPLTNAHNELRKTHECVRTLYTFASRIDVKAGEWQQIWQTPWEPKGRDELPDLTLWTPSTFESNGWIEYFYTGAFYRCVKQVAEMVNAWILLTNREVPKGTSPKSIFSLWELMNLQTQMAFVGLVQLRWYTDRGTADSKGIQLSARQFHGQDAKYYVSVLLALRGIDNVLF